jgi:hypothetical protein
MKKASNQSIFNINRWICPVHQVLFSPDEVYVGVYNLQ